ncbi:MAG: histidine kinase [Patulibacter sp.]
MTERGHHTVLLGMAPGVGKTYRALEDVRLAREAGRDAIVAVVETHGRRETAERIGDLEVLPRRAVEHGGVAQQELDLAGLLRRAPALALIDELAHANAPGLEHEKRWQDVEAVLDAGIDVISTVNVQHLESLNDQVAELTGVRVRETVPDRVLVDAEDVMVIDLPPEALLRRLRDGRIYGPERIAAALNNFFRIEQLDALREVALLQAAEEVGARRIRSQPPPCRPGDVDSGRPGSGDATCAVQERMLVLVSARPSGQRVLRRAWRSARRLHAPLTILHVRAPGPAPGDDERRRIDAIADLARRLGIELRIEEADDLTVAAARVVRELRVSYVIAGAPRPARGLRRLGRPLAVRLLDALPGVDVRFVADRDEPAPPRV